MIAGVSLTVIVVSVARAARLDGIGRVEPDEFKYPSDDELQTWVETSQPPSDLASRPDESE